MPALRFLTSSRHRLETPASLQNTVETDLDVSCLSRSAGSHSGPRGEREEHAVLLPPGARSAALARASPLRPVLERGGRSCPIMPGFGSGSAGRGLSRPPRGPSRDPTTRPLFPFYTRACKFRSQCWASRTAGAADVGVQQRPAFPAPPAPARAAVEGLPSSHVLHPPCWGLPHQSRWAAPTAASRLGPASPFPAWPSAVLRGPGLGGQSPGLVSLMDSSVRIVKRQKKLFHEAVPPLPGLRRGAVLGGGTLPAPLLRPHSPVPPTDGVWPAEGLVLRKHLLESLPPTRVPTTQVVLVPVTRTPVPPRKPSLFVSYRCCAKPCGSRGPGLLGSRAAFCSGALGAGRLTASPEGGCPSPG